MARPTAGAICAGPGRGSPPPGRPATTRPRAAATSSVVTGREGTGARGRGSGRLASDTVAKWTSKGSIPTGCPSTWPASWTATGVGPPKRGLPRTEGHRAGEEALFDAIQGALDLGIDWFTVYAFSTENWRRPADEVRFLLSVISDKLLLRRRDELNEMGVRIRFIGRRDWRVPRRVLHRMDESVEMTKHNRA